MTMADQARHPDTCTIADMVVHELGWKDNLLPERLLLKFDRVLFRIEQASAAATREAMVERCLEIIVGCGIDRDKRERELLKHVAEIVRQDFTRG